MKDGNDIQLGENDYVFITNGSIVESTDIGDWSTPAKLLGVPESGLEELSGNVDGTTGLITFTDSSWLLSFDVSRQPHYANQPKGDRPEVLVKGATVSYRAIH